MDPEPAIARTETVASTMDRLQTGDTKLATARATDRNTSADTVGKVSPAFFLFLLYPLSMIARAILSLNGAGRASVQLLSSPGQN